MMTMKMMMMMMMMMMEVMWWEFSMQEWPVKKRKDMIKEW